MFAIRRSSQMNEILRIDENRRYDANFGYSKSSKWSLGRQRHDTLEQWRKIESFGEEWPVGDSTRLESMANNHLKHCQYYCTSQKVWTTEKMRLNVK